MTKEIRKYRHCYLWIAPFFILFAVFQLYPTLYGFYLGFTKYDGLTTPVSIGLQNFRTLLADKKVIISLQNTLALWAMIVPMRVMLATVIASFLNESNHLGSKIYTKVVLLPYVTAAIVVAIVFRILYTTDGGMINNTLKFFGLPAVQWLDSTTFSKISIAIMNLWKMTGYFSLIMLAGMQKIPTSINDACKIDGAGPVRKFLSVTIPLMIPEMAFSFMISTIWIFQNTADSMLLTRGGPMNSSLSFMYYIYRTAYENSKMGYASALSIILFLILFIVGIFLMQQYSRRVEDKE